MSRLPDIASLLPHRPPMRLLDEVREFDLATATAVCRARVGESPFLRGRSIRAVVALEHMAQASAACTSLIERRAGLTAVAARGFLVAVPSFSLEAEEFFLGETLDVRATRISCSGDTASFECDVSRQGAVAARARLLVVKESS